MTPEVSLLLVTTLSIAFIHTLAGPDHYLPFIIMAKARDWSVRKTVWFTVLCGIGHVGSSVVLGIIGIALGIAVGTLELWEGQRGSVISILFLSFGFAYFVWGIFRAIKNRPHKHLHVHEEEVVHEHEHSHSHEHVHVHTKKSKVNITPWILFTIFIFGPCEPLIPLVMYPAAQNNVWLTIAVTTLFSVVTISTMLVLVLLAIKGINFIPLKKIERYNHAIAGLAITLCGVGMVFFGL
jgi:nickel/cobalt transporter (NicO) family protein